MENQTQKSCSIPLLFSAFRPRRRSENRA